MLVYSQLVCLPPVVIFDHVMFICIIFVSSFGFTGSEKPHWGVVSDKIYLFIFIYILINEPSLRCSKVACLTKFILMTGHLSNVWCPWRSNNFS